MKYLWLVILCLCANAQIVRRAGDEVWVRWTNVPPCAVIQASTDLIVWQDAFLAHNYIATNWQTLEYSIPVRLQSKEFWRVKPCNQNP